MSTFFETKEINFQSRIHCPWTLGESPTWGEYLISKLLLASSLRAEKRQYNHASAKTTTGFSLNDCLPVGPKLQDDFFNLLVRFRLFKIALSADVAKMYRQVELDKAD